MTGVGEGNAAPPGTQTAVDEAGDGASVGCPLEGAGTSSGWARCRPTIWSTRGSAIAKGPSRAFGRHAGSVVALAGRWDKSLRTRPGHRSTRLPPPVKLALIKDRTGRHEQRLRASRVDTSHDAVGDVERTGRITARVGTVEGRRLGRAVGAGARTRHCGPGSAPESTPNDCKRSRMSERRAALSPFRSKGVGSRTVNWSTKAAALGGTASMANATASVAASDARRIAAVVVCPCCALIEAKTVRKPVTSRQYAAGRGPCAP